MKFRTHPVRVRTEFHLSLHLPGGVPTVTGSTVTTPLCPRIPHPHPKGWLLLLAEDEGFEPPQTESESGVLPLHKSSICRMVETTGLEPVTSCV